MGRSISNLVDKLIYSRRNRVVFSLALTFVLFALMTLTNHYGGGSDDDWAISLALSGRFPESGLCLFVNAAVSQVVVALNTAFPAQNWFLAIEGLIAACAFFSITYGALTHMKPLFAFLLIGAVEAFVLPGCTYESNFTFIAGIATLAGFILLVGSTKTKSRSVVIPIVGVAFCVLGFLWRSEVLLLSIPFFAITLGFIFLSRKREVGRAEHTDRTEHEASHETRSQTDGLQPSRKPSAVAVIRASVPYIAVVVLCACFYAYNNMAWQAPGWSDWKDFNAPRSELSDYPTPDYITVADDLAAHDLSQSDYLAPRVWITADPDVFTTETMEYFASLSDTLPAQSGFERILSHLSDVAKALPSHVIVVVAIAAIAILASRKKSALPQVIALLGLAVVICAYFAGIGRLPERVETFVWLFSLCAIFLSIPHNAYDNDPAAVREKLLGPYKTREVAASAAGAAMWAGATLLVLILTVPKFNPGLLPAYLDQDSFVPEDPTIEYALQNNDKILVWGTSSYFGVEHAYRLRFLPSEDFLSRNISLGGWSDRSPYTMANRERIGMTNIIRGLAENPDAYLVIDEGSEGYTPGLVLSLIQEHYYPNASMEKVDSFPGKYPKQVFTVWKVSKNA